MDFILGLPRTWWEHDSIFVVVEAFSEMVHLIPYKKISEAVHIIDFLFREVVRLHDLLRSIVLYRDTKFVGFFWWTL